MTNQKKKVNSSEPLLQKIFPTILGGVLLFLITHYLTLVRPDRLNVYESSQIDVESRKQFNVSVTPIQIKISWLKRGLLRLEVSNSNRRTLKNGTITITFPKGIHAMRGDPWGATSDTNIFLHFGDLNPGVTLILQPVEIEFFERSLYEATYVISGEDVVGERRKLLIKAI